MDNKISIPFHWDSNVWAITIITLVVLVGAGFHLALKSWSTEMLWLKYLLIAIFVATVIIGVGYMPIRMKANAEKITVTRLFGAIEIPHSEIVEIRSIPKSDIASSLRVFGSGGLFGYLGLFKNGKLGNYTMYATELDKLILIRTNSKKYVFSCSSPKELLSLF